MSSPGAPVAAAVSAASLELQAIRLPLQSVPITLRSSCSSSPLPRHSRVMKQILLRVATMWAEIVCSEIRQHLSSHFAFPGKIFFSQDSFDPNINGECCDSLVGEEHDAIRHFHSYAGEVAQLLPQLSVRERAPRIQIRLPGRDALRRFQQVYRAITQRAFSQFTLARSCQAAGRGKGKKFVSADFFLFPKSLTQRP
jgi:hypothetical protein